MRDANTKEHIVFKTAPVTNISDIDTSDLIVPVYACSNHRIYLSGDDKDYKEDFLQIKDNNPDGLVEYDDNENLQFMIYDVADTMFLLCLPLKERERMDMLRDSVPFQRRLYEGKETLIIRYAVVPITKQELIDGIDIDGWYDVVYYDYGTTFLEEASGYWL